MTRTINIFLWIAFLSLSSAFSMLPGLRSSNTSPTAVWGRVSCAEEAVVSRENLVMMPATLERDAVLPAGPAVLDRPETQQKERVGEPTKERKREGYGAWEVRIYNDGLNTREHVARSLVQITGMPEITAYQTMMQAHQNGIAVVGRWIFEIAEMYHDALRNSGIVCDIVPVDEEK